MLKRTKIMYGMFALVSLSSAGIRAAQANQDDVVTSIVQLQEGLINDTTQLYQVKERLRTLENENEIVRKSLEEQENAMGASDAENKRFRATLKKLGEENRKLKEHLKDLEDTLIQTEETITTQQSLLSTQKVTMTELTAENARISDLEGVVALAVGEREKSETRVVKLEATLQSQSLELATVHTDLENAQRIAADQESVIKDLQQKFAQAEKDQQDLLRSSVSTSRAGLDEEGPNLAAELGAAVMPQAENADLHQKIQKAQREIDEKAVALAQLRNELQTLQQVHRTCAGTTSEVVAGLHQTIKQRETDITALQKKIQVDANEVRKQLDAQGLFYFAKRNELQEQVTVLTRQIKLLEQQLAAGQAKVLAQDKDITVFRLSEQEVVQLKVLRDRIVTITMQGNFEVQVGDLERNFTARMKLMSSQIAEKQAELVTHMGSRATSYLGTFFKGAAFFGVMTAVGDERAVGIGGVAGAAASGAAASVSISLKDRAEKKHHDRKEALESEIKALELEVEAYQLCLDIIKIAVDIRNQIKAAQRA